MSATLIPIAPPDALDVPELAAYRGLPDRDLATLARPGAEPSDEDDGAAGHFIAEGDLVVRALAASSFAVRSVLVAEPRVDPLRDVLDALPDGTPAYVASSAFMSTIVGFPIHRGVLALGVRAPRDADRLLEDLGDGLVVALVGLTNHDNVGGIFRNAAAFGARAVLLDDTSCDPLYRKAIRVSTGAALRVPFARAGSGSDLITRLERHGFEVVALTPSGREGLAALPPVRRRALVLGTEGPGLPPAVIARARGVRIDMVAGFDSLNVAVTSGIALYEASRREFVGPAGEALLTAAGSSRAGP